MWPGVRSDVPQIPRSTPATSPRPTPWSAFHHQPRRDLMRCSERCAASAGAGSSGIQPDGNGLLRPAFRRRRRCQAPPRWVRVPPAPPGVPRQNRSDLGIRVFRGSFACGVRLAGDMANVGRRAPEDTLGQDGHGVGGAGESHQPGGGSGAAFEVVAAHSGSSAHGAEGERAWPRGIDCLTRDGGREVVKPGGSGGSGRRPRPPRASWCLRTPTALRHRADVHDPRDSGAAPVRLRRPRC